jgi:predicted acyl esterase
VGHPKLVLWVRCLAADAVKADFVGRITDVFPDGTSINICDGVNRLDFSKLDRDTRGAFKVEVDIYPVSQMGLVFHTDGQNRHLWASLGVQTAVRFAAGHRIRLHVASAGFPRWERNLHAYGYESLIPVAFQVSQGWKPAAALRHFNRYYLLSSAGYARGRLSRLRVQDLPTCRAGLSVFMLVGAV